MIFNVTFSYFLLLLEFETLIKISRLLNEEFIIIKGLNYFFIYSSTLQL